MARKNPAHLRRGGADDLSGDTTAMTPAEEGGLPPASTPVERALRALEPPRHASGFWTRLDERLLQGLHPGGGGGLHAGQCPKDVVLNRREWIRFDQRDMLIGSGMIDRLDTPQAHLLFKPLTITDGHEALGDAQASAFMKGKAAQLLSGGVESIFRLIHEDQFKGLLAQDLAAKL